jgi:hypothetical protein
MLEIQMLETPALESVWSFADSNFEFVLVAVRQDFRNSDLDRTKAQALIGRETKAGSVLFGTLQVGISRWTQEVA